MLVEEIYIFDTTTKMNLHKNTRCEISFLTFQYLHVQIVQDIDKTFVQHTTLDLKCC